MFILLLIWIICFDIYEDILEVKKVVIFVIFLGVFLWCKGIFLVYLVFILLDNLVVIFVMMNFGVMVLVWILWDFNFWVMDLVKLIILVFEVE